MSDFKFNCPNCGQHLSGDERYGGLQITCPACRNSVIVPLAPAGSAGVRMATPAPIAPPQPAVAPQPQMKTCGLAIASLVCSIATVLVGPFGFIPGIICGHLARKKIARTPGLQGAGMAKAGLIIGYIALGLVVLVVVGFLGFFFFMAHKIQQMGVSPGS